jgi:hypothetical protein
LYALDDNQYPLHKNRLISTRYNMVSYRSYNVTMAFFQMRQRIEHRLFRIRRQDLHTPKPRARGHQGIASGFASFPTDPAALQQRPTTAGAGDGSDEG